LSHQKHSHCSFCGAPFSEPVRTHAACAACGNETWLSPIPVAVMVLPIIDDDGRLGVLLTRRGIQPSLGELALPGGYVEFGETLEAAARREVHEETGIDLPPDWPIRITHSRTSRDVIAVAFCTAKPVPASMLRSFVPNPETQELVVTHEPMPLCFSTHTEALALHFTRAS
jgi:8-oxo-dGTP pyrophosphatase MutT (NUDIX family)